MELDEVCELVTDARYAYGKAGKYVSLQITLILLCLGKNVLITEFTQRFLLTLQVKDTAKYITFTKLD